MTSPERFDHLRRPALDMLDAGNSITAVSQVLAVPAQVIEHWREQAGPPPAPSPSRPTPAGPQGQARGPLPAFTKTLVVKRSFKPSWANQAATGWGVTVLWSALMAYTLLKPAAFGKPLFVLDFTATFACVFWWIQRLRPLVTLTSDAIVVSTPLGRSTLPYADLADWSLPTHVKVMNYKGHDVELYGRMLTLSSRRPGASRIELFVHDHIEIGHEVTERLDLVKQANAHPKPPTPAAR